ncbi:MAG: T9SS type A sorting domain-containing protein [Calditrichaeota bacterium]|nr:T9SS type A sorting domain-containing protein [Calditrichota bacterium]
MRMVIGVILCALFVAGAHAQITLTQSNAPSLGQSYISYNASSVDFDGTSGSGNMNWNVSALEFSENGGGFYVDPTTTPYTSDFPTATLAITIDGNSYSYARIASNGFWNLGFATSEGGGFLSVFDVEQLILPFPCTNNTSWTSVMRFSIEAFPGFVTTTVDSSLVTVNAYGTMTTPLWSDPVLRVYSHGYSRVYLNGNPLGETTESWDYQYISTDPSKVVTFSSVDATGPNYSSGDVSFSAPGGFSAEEPRGPVAESFTLNQNYPNPFNPTTNLPIELAKNARVELTIYNEAGQVVEQQEFELSAGQHTVPIDGSAWSSGSYFAKLSAGNEIQTRRMVLVK